MSTEHSAESDAPRVDLTDAERADLLEALTIPSAYNGPVISTVECIIAARLAPLQAALAEARGEHNGGWFWSQAEWADWSNNLAMLIPGDVVDEHGNPEGAQESIIEDCLRAYVEGRVTSPGATA